MHDSAYRYVARARDLLGVRGAGLVVDLGGRDVNGSTRDLFPLAEWVAVDQWDGLGVTIVADAARWTPDRAYDVAVSTEVLEHTPDWPFVLRTMFLALRPGGAAIVTAASRGRRPHSAVDGCEVRPGEWYANLDHAVLHDALVELGFVDVDVEYCFVDDWHGGDVYARAVKPT